MKHIELGRITEQGHRISERIESEFGSLRAPETQVRSCLSRRDFVQSLRRDRPPQTSEEVSCIPLDEANMAMLTSPDAVGRMFGIMGSRKIIHSGIITDRTKPGELHFTRLTEGGGVAIQAFRGVDTRGRIMVEIGGLIQHPAVGTAAADADRGTASEIGHTVQGLSALTDPALLQALKTGDHWVHGWAASDGIAAAITNRPAGSSTFAVQTDAGLIENGFLPEIMVEHSCRSLLLVDHESITDEAESARLGVSTAELAVGMGSLAAQSQLGQHGSSFETYLMRTMRTI